MLLELRRKTASLVTLILVLGCCACSFADDAEPTNQLSLADLAAYRAALSGKATADNARSSDSPAPVGFKELWKTSDSLRGRRVIVQGRVERIFRQGPIGSFPALAEIWIASPAGDPFCLVVPQASGSAISPEDGPGPARHAKSKRIPELGQTVQFTGTFLKMVRYTAGDGARLAPLVVGDKPPVSVRDATKVHGTHSFPGDGGGRVAGSPVNWLMGITLALLAAGVIAWRHLHGPSQPARLQRQRRRTAAALVADPPLEFIEPPINRN